MENGHVFHESLLMVIIRRIQEQLSAKQRIGKNSLNPLAELNQCVFDSAYGFIVNVVDVLQCGQRTDFANYSGKQTACFFGIVSDDEELVGEL